MTPSQGALPAPMPALGRDVTAGTFMLVPLTHSATGHKVPGRAFEIPAQRWLPAVTRLSSRRPPRRLALHEIRIDCRIGRPSRRTRTGRHIETVHPAVQGAPPGGRSGLLYAFCPIRRAEGLGPAWGASSDKEFTSELARLQDRAEPAPWEQVKEVMAQSLGAPAGQVFAELQPEPAAAASIAQVHKARRRCGDGPGAVVAVKVQRPHIRATVEQDLDILLRMAARLENRPLGACGRRCRRCPRIRRRPV